MPRVNLLLYLLINLLFVSRAFSQYTPVLESLRSEVESGKQEQAFLQLKKMKIPSSTPDKALYYFLLAKCNDLKNNHEEAFSGYLKAKEYYIAADSIGRAMDINLDIAFSIDLQKNTKHDYTRYVDEYFAYATKENDSLRLAKGYAHMAAQRIDRKQFTESLKYFKLARAINSRVKDKDLEISINSNLAVLYNEDLNKPDSALYYLRKNVDYLKQENRSEDLCYNYINQAAAYYYMGDRKRAVEFLKMADAQPLNKYLKSTKESIYYFLSVNYSELEDFKSAYDYLALSRTYGDSLGREQQEIAISDIQVKYHTKEKELENEILKGGIKTNRILLYTFLVLLLASVVIAYLILKNSHRKVRISRQEKLIEEQKLEKALKDYELSSIDLMLEGQEKERQRIADDLHDNLGSMLATLKLNFENLKLRKHEIANDENKLYERTDELIEEAYQKVRRLAHSKNAGVFANEGLIPALKKMAEKISIPGKLNLQVIAFGFDDRLENNLEIAVFRMAQELATNIIKHSEASEATLHITNHDDNINIIIEDNGRGFETEKIAAANGMGLQNIRKKTQQLGGTFTIDSTPGRGTTIIIDLPL